jgi:uncharacterized protein with von Willebrand factor type A (vWA) domain
VPNDLPFLHLFYLLRAKGLPLCIRDYRDAIAALRDGHGLYSRERLVWLAKALWARSAEEERLIEFVLQELPEPSESEVKAIAPPLCGERELRSASKPETPPIPTSTETPSVGFSTPGEAGAALPRPMMPPLLDEALVLTPRLPVGERSLIQSLRRYRRAVRHGYSDEIDLDATVRLKSETGVLTRPAYSPGRANTARLVVLLDVSPSMAPWQPFLDLVEESLAESRLGAYFTGFFHDSVRDELYSTPTLHRPLPLRAALQRFEASPLLLVSDAGAAKARFNARRLRETADFLSRIQQQWRPAVWLNPMPRHRWPGSTAGSIARLPGLTMIELSADGFAAAIDRLRGARG